MNLFTVPDALAAGWTRESLRHAVRAGVVLRVRVGVYAPASEDAHGLDTVATARRRLLRAAAAAARRCEPAVISHAGAAALYGLPLLLRTERACLTSPPGSGAKELPGVHVHRAGLPPGHVETVDGLDVTSVPRTALDVAREHGVEAGLVVADAALAAGRTTAGELADVRDLMSTWPGRRAARAVAELAQREAESPLETLSRLRMIQAGLPMPRLQQVILDDHGGFVARGDFYWDEYGVVGEADGKYSDPDEIVRERRREQALAALGLVVVRWEWRDVWRFEPVARRLSTAFERGLAPGHPGRRWTLAR